MQILEVGQVVYACNITKEQKWDVLYEGPYKFVGLDECKCYALQDFDGKLLVRHFPMKCLKVVSKEFNLPKDGTVFQVDAILGDCMGALGYEYLVKWKHSVTKDSWEPQENYQYWKIISTYWSKKHDNGTGKHGGNSVGLCHSRRGGS